jgi:ABC-type lipoprotein release transport system permease subunit
MFLIFKIAFKNLFLHKGRSFAIGGVIFIGAVCMILGNGVIAGREAGMEHDIVKGLFGDITLISSERKNDSLTDNTEPLKMIEKYEEIRKVATIQNDIDRILPLILGYASVLDISNGLTDTEEIETIFFWGIDFDSYKKMYCDSVVIVEGEPLKPGERGILINEEYRKSVYNLHDIWILPENGSIVKENLPKDALADYRNLHTRNDMVLMGMTGSTSAMDVRVPVKGIFKYKRMNELISSFNLIDIETARECMGFITAGDMKTDLSQENQNLMNSTDGDLNSLFSKDEMVDKKVDVKTADNYDAILKTHTKEKVTVDYNNGAYTLAQINLKQGIASENATDRLNQSFKSAGLDGYVRAMSWKHAYPILSRYSKIFHSGMLIFVYVIYFAAILMITNIMSMAAVERTDELGTMRIIGARKSFIAGMFVTETSLLSFLFGGLGILTGIVAVFLFDTAKFSTTSPYLQLLFGGDIFYPIADINAVISGIMSLIVITAIAMIYPVFVARRIKPMDAIKRN